MDWNQKFGKLVAAFSLFAVTCQLCAEDSTDAKIRNLESRVNAMEYRKNACMVNPPARPTQKCDWGAFVTVEPLLLKAQEDGLEFAVVTQNGPLVSATNADAALQGRSKGKSIHFDWDWGVRVGLGANLPHDAWDVVLNWTHFFTTASRRVTAGPTQLVMPTFLHPQTGGTSFNGSPGILASQSGAGPSAKSSWKLKLNEIDLELGRQFFVSKWLTLKPHAGLRTAWIRQRDNTRYDGLLNPTVASATDLFFSRANVFMKCNYWGIGLIGGLDTQWGIGCGWSLFANFDASILYGYFDVNHRENGVVDSPLPTTNALGIAVGATDPLFNYSRFYHVGRFITDFIMGIRYDYMFCDDTYHLGVDLGWEHHLFFGQNEFVFFNSANEVGQSFSNQGDLSIQGFSLKIRFDF